MGGFPRMKHWCVVVMVLLSLAGAVSSQQHESLYAAYHDAAAKLIGAAMVDSAGWAKLEYLSDRIGNRVSGSETLERAVEWSAAQMKKDGLENVTIQPVNVPHWVRGQERASLVSPITRPLSMLGLGGSVGTPGGGITAEVVPVSSFDDLEKKGRQA